MVGRLFNREEKIKKTTLTRRTVLRNAAMTAGVPAVPFVRSSRAAATVVPKGSKLVLAWHTNIRSRGSTRNRRYGDLTVVQRVAEAVKARGFCSSECWIGSLPIYV